MEEGKKGAPLQILLDPELRSRFKVVCAKQDRSMADVTREFIAWYTAKKESDE